MSSIQVRPATLRDAKAIAQIHTVSAQEAYKGLVPDEQLKAMSSVEKRQAYWREAIEYCEPQVQVAVDGEKIVGFVGYDRSRDEKSRPTTGEIWAIYAAPTHWNQGIGLALWDAAREGLIDEGCTEVTLWVMLKNERALRFFAASHVVQRAPEMIERCRMLRRHPQRQLAELRSAAEVVLQMRQEGAADQGFRVVARRQRARHQRLLLVMNTIFPHLQPHQLQQVPYLV